MPGKSVGMCNMWKYEFLSFSMQGCVDPARWGNPLRSGPIHTDAVSPLQSDVPSANSLTAVGSRTFSMAKEGTTETLNFSDTSGTSSASTCTWPGRGESCECGSKKAAAARMQKLGSGAALPWSQAVMPEREQPDAHSDEGGAAVVCCKGRQHCIHVLAGLAPGCPKVYNSLLQEGASV